jgi:nitroreductase
LATRLKLGSNNILKEEINMTDKEKIALEAIFARRSIRNYIENKPVEKWKIIKLLESAMAAPSACNNQPWEFIIVSEKDMMDKLKTATESHNAPMAIITCANTSIYPWENDDWKKDCSAAVENMLIAAAALGLGSLWIGWCHDDILREAFGIPEHIQILNITYFGYYDDDKPIGTRYAEDAIFWEKYEPSRIRPPKKVIDYGGIKLNDLSVSPPALWE